MSALAGEPQPYVAIVEDDAAMRKSLRLLLASVGLTSEAFVTGQELLDSLADRVPDCLVIDLRLPDMSGIQVFRRAGELCGFCPPSLIITGHGDVPSAVEALKEGIMDFLEKPFVPQRLLDLVQQSIARNREQCAARQKRFRTDKALAGLSPREQEVLDHLLLGKPNKQIAAEMDLSVKTVATHRSHILQKVGAGSLVELVQMLQLADRIE